MLITENGSDLLSFDVVKKRGGELVQNFRYWIGTLMPHSFFSKCILGNFKQDDDHSAKLRHLRHRPGTNKTILFALTDGAQANFQLNFYELS